MKFKEIKHLLTKKDNRIVVVYDKYGIVASYSFDYRERELFYKAFLEDTTCDEYLVLSIVPHIEDYGYGDGIMVEVEGDENGL